jgi:cell division protein FtsZ
MIMMDDGPPERRPLQLAIEDAHSAAANIKVVGIGGGGGNAVNRMIDARLAGVQFISANTDCQALAANRAAIKLQLGAKLTKGLGAGANPEVGRSAALEDTEKVVEALTGADMVFITAGLGGGTGTGATPIIANLAREMGALVIAVVTLPFAFEGKHRRQQADTGLNALRQVADTVITIPNDKLLHTVQRGTPLGAAFIMADDVLRQAVQGISDLITIPGEINLDFADVKTVMAGMGMALMGTGEAEGEHRAVEAAQRAISSPLLEDASIHGAKGVLINISGGLDMTLHEVSEAAKIIQEAASADANIIFGTVIGRADQQTVKVTVIATGFARDSVHVASFANVRPQLPLQPHPQPSAQTLQSQSQPQHVHPHPHAQPQHPPRQSEEADPAQQAKSKYLRRGAASHSLEFDAADEGFTPNYSQMKDDLDVPAFLRKQMD